MIFKSLSNEIIPIWRDWAIECAKSSRWSFSWLFMFKKLFSTQIVFIYINIKPCRLFNVNNAFKKRNIGLFQFFWAYRCIETAE